MPALAILRGHVAAHRAARGLGFFRLWERLAPRGPMGAAAFLTGAVFEAIGRSATKDTETSFYRRPLQRVCIFTTSPRELRVQEGDERRERAELVLPLADDPDVAQPKRSVE
jgi:hypothetical protein